MKKIKNSGNIQIPQDSNRTNWRQFFIGVTIGVIGGAIIGVGSTFFALHGRISKLEGIIESLKPNMPQSTPNAVLQQSTTAKPEDFISIIQEQQKKNVKESYGPLDHQCFNEEDLKQFVKNKRTEQILDSIKKDPHFLDVVLAIRKMKPGERLKLLSSADKPLRPTWEELGKISRDGQTKAGQDAEKMIATAVVNFVKELVKMPEAEFIEIYND